jgi:hypothetical protein
MPNYTEAPNSDSDCMQTRGRKRKEREELEEMTLNEFLRYRGHEMSDEVANWYLCGGEEREGLASINVEEYRVGEREIEVSMDIDSVLVSSERIPTRSDVQYFPFSSMSSSLQTHNHMYHQVDEERVRLSTIPNQMIGRFGIGGAYTLLEFFPRMREKMRTGQWRTTVAHEKRRYWYDQVLWPSIQQVLPRHQLVHWPSSYDDARERSTMHGTFNFQWYWMKGEYIGQVHEMVNSRLHMVGEAGDEYQGRFYHVFCRGVKLQSMRVGMDAEQIQLPTGLDMEVIGGTEQVQVDIGVEFLAKDGRKETMVWARSELDSLMSRMMGKATRIRIDEFCTMYSLSGVAAESGIGGERGVEYMQAYMNIKCPLYGRVREGEMMRFSKTLGMEQAFNGGEEYWRRMETLRAGFERARTREWSARLEVRVRYSELGQRIGTLRQQVEEIIRQGRHLYTIPTETLYQLQIARFEACEWVIERIQRLTKIRRVHRGVLTLLAVVVWIVNALVSRPEDHSEHEWLRLWIGEQEAIGKGKRDRNLFFISKIDFSRLRVPVSASDKQLKRLFGRGKLEKIRKLVASGHMGRISRGVVTRRMARAGGARVEAEGLEVDDMLTQARNMMETFGRDLWSIFPKGRGGRSFLVDDMERSELGLEDFREGRIQEIVTNGYFIPESQWQRRFDLYFPPMWMLDNVNLGKSRWNQGWERLEYRGKYIEYMTQGGREAQEEFRNELFNIFNTLSALPNSQKSGKVWQTRKPKGKEDTHVYFVNKV